MEGFVRLRHTFKSDTDKLFLRPCAAPAVKEQVKVCTSAMEACTGAEGICVLTEWDEFKSLDWEAIYETMAKPAMVFDGRGILDADKLRAIGFKVFSIGKGINL